MTAEFPQSFHNPESSGQAKTRALCTTHPDLDWHSTDPAEQEACIAVCGGCPARVTCLAGARARGEQFGIWGGESFNVVDMAEPVAWVRPAIYAPVHNRAHYVSGCRHPDCLAANASYVAKWRATRTPAPTKPPVEPPLSLFDEAPITERRRISV